MIRSYKTLPKSAIDITIDDFGISRGVNRACEDLLEQGYADNLSIMTDGKYFHNAVAIAKKYQKRFKLGLHFDLTYSSYFRKSKYKGFLHIFLLGFLRPKSVIRNSYKQLVRQMRSVEKKGLKVAYLDSHRHVHMIPAVMYAVLKYQEKHPNISRIRYLNETPSLQGFAKSAIILACRAVNKVLLNVTCEHYFISLAHSCEMSKNVIENLKIPAKFNKVEIMLHPSLEECEVDIDDCIEKSHLERKSRSMEYETAKSLTLWKASSN